MSTLSFLYSQLFVEPPVPKHDFTGQTIIITGANRGIGLEAIKHLLRLNVARVIMAVRSTDKGHAAAKEAEDATNRPGAIKVYELDMDKADSVQRFAAEMCVLDRIDGVILNAGIYTQVFQLVEDYERTVTVNVINTFRLALLLLPALKSSAQKWSISPRITVVTSDRHVMVNLHEWKTPNTFKTLNKVEKTNMNHRYYTSKLLQLLLARALAEKLRDQNSNPQGHHIIVNSLTPGYCVSGLLNDAVGIQSFGFWLLAKATARTTEMGGRLITSAVAMGEESHGKYLNDGEVQESALSPFVKSTEGGQAQEKVWNELLDLLEHRSPGIALMVNDNRGV